MNRWVEREMYGWGRHPRVRGLVARPERRAEVKAALDDRGDGPILAHGLGRSYGDAALVANGRMVLTRRLDRMLSFDPTTGWLEVEAGVSLEEIIRTFVPRGFFPPVVPGTQFVTIGGALGCDIHGKNHHVDGTFADHVRRVELLTGSGEVVVDVRAAGVNYVDALFVAGRYQIKPPLPFVPGGEIAGGGGGKGGHGEQAGAAGEAGGAGGAGGRGCGPGGEVGGG